MKSFRTLLVLVISAAVVDFSFTSPSASEGDARVFAETFDVATQIPAKLATSGIADPEGIEQAADRITQLVETAHHSSDDQEALHDEALNLLALVMPAAERLGMHREMARLLTARHHIGLQRNQLDDSERLLMTALDHLQHANAGEDELARMYGEISYLFILRGEFARGIGYLRRKVAINLEAHDPEALAIDFYRIGDAYLQLGELDVARRYFEQSLLPFEDQRGRDYWDSINKLGTIDRIEGSPATALEKHVSVHRFYHELGEYREIPVTIELARDHLALGNLDRSRRLARQVVIDPRVMTEQELDALLLLIEISMMQNQPERAVQLIEQTHDVLAGEKGEVLTPYSHPLRRIRLAELSAQLFTQVENVDRLVAAGEMGLEVYNHVRRGVQLSGNDLLAWAAKAEPFISQYIEGLYRLRPEAILRVLETAYSHGSTVAQSAPHPASGNTSQEIERLERYLAAERQVMDAQNEVREATGEAQRAAIGKALIERDEARERYLLSATSLPKSNLPSQELQPSKPVVVPDHTVVLRYYTRDSISFVIVIGGRQQEIYPLPSKQRIELLVSKLRTSLFVHGSKDKYAVLRDLSILIPQQVLEDETLRRLVVVTDDVTHDVPFSAIDIDDGATVYGPVARQFEVVRTYSVGEYFHLENNLAANRRPPVPNIYIFADPAFGDSSKWAGSSAEFRSWTGSLQRLPHTAQEAQWIKDIYPEGTVSLFLGQSATTELLMSSAARSADVLHIATHGYFSEATPDIVGIATSGIDTAGNIQSGFLSLTQLLSQPFYSNLIIISGCETMRGEAFRGIGVRSLTHGLITQGAGAVIGTLWKVSDSATAEFMRHFYTHLNTYRGDAALALNRAQVTFMSTDSFSEPLHWAAFVLTSSSANIDKSVFVRRIAIEH